MTKKKSTSHPSVSISFPAAEEDTYLLELKQMVTKLAAALGKETHGIQSGAFQSLIKNHQILRTSEDFSTLAGKANLQKKRLYIAFWMEANDIKE